MTSILVPQANPRAGYYAHQEAIDDAIARVLASGSYILGGEASAFELEYADGLVLAVRSHVPAARMQSIDSQSPQYRCGLNCCHRFAHIGSDCDGCTDDRCHPPAFRYRTCDVYNGTRGASLSAGPTTASLAGNSRRVGCPSVWSGLRPDADHGGLQCSWHPAYRRLRASTRGKPQWEKARHLRSRSSIQFLPD